MAEATETGFGLFGTRNGEETEINWSDQRLVMERVLEHGLYQAQGYTNLEIRPSEGRNTPQKQSLQAARENAVKGLPMKEFRKEADVKRAAMMPDTRFVSWAEFKRAVEAAGVLDTDPINKIACAFPIDLDGDPPLKVARSDLNIVTIAYLPE